MPIPLDKYMLEYPVTRTPKRTCTRCGGPLGPRVDGEHHTTNGQEVCPDCYFADVGREIERHPIGGLGVRGGTH